ncbi:hypothetical protein D3C87_1949650 [compost metagenome]
MTSQGLKPCSPTQAAITWGTCDRARKLLRAAAPSTIRKIIAVELAVARHAWTMAFRSRLLAESAITNVPAAPMAAASVGVKMPA